MSIVPPTTELRYVSEGPAGRIRRAADLMHERAVASIAGPWTSTPDAQVVRASDAAQLADCFQIDPAGDANAVHMASWHPEVALAVARLLGAAALFWDDIENGGRAGMLEEDALEVADAFLGGGE